ncbi:hypothetical protein HY469_01300 [Candidatus Roizmanbacteria bacterium]|nr:hypothetical protein [Candidatus Roizmanbacteria bacterium]
MKKVTLSDLADQKLLIALTLLLAIMSGASSLIEPQYVTEQEAFLATLFILPLIAFWFELFWNGILTKIVTVKEISYGVALLLTAAIAIIIG